MQSISFQQFQMERTKINSFLIPICKFRLKLLSVATQNTLGDDLWAMWPCREYCRCSRCVLLFIMFFPSHPGITRSALSDFMQFDDYRTIYIEAANRNWTGWGPNMQSVHRTGTRMWRTRIRLLNSELHNFLYRIWLVCLALFSFFKNEWRKKQNRLFFHVWAIAHLFLALSAKSPSRIRSLRYVGLMLIWIAASSHSNFAPIK